MTNEKKARDLGVSFSEYLCYKSNEHEKESMFYVETNGSSKGSGMHDTAIPVLQRAHGNNGTSSCTK